jgi:hypothetical protein
MGYMGRLGRQRGLRQGDEATSVRPSGTASSATVSLWRRNSLMSVRLLASVIVLAYVTCVSSVASADVDSVGGLEPASSSLKGGLHEVNQLVNSSHNGEYKCGSAWAYSDFHDEAFGLVMGNCKAGWIFEVVDYGGPSEQGVYSYGGYAEGALDGCGWVESNTAPEKIGTVREPHHCGSGSEVSTPETAFREKYNGEGVGTHTTDGYYVVNKVPCKEYANFRPWSKETSVEKEEIRTVPAYATEKSDIPALKWRYVTKYESSDGSGKYVMVRDTRVAGGEGNWVFVPRSCLPATLPESEGELVPPPPAVTTNGATGVETPNATLNATVNPNGVPTKYYFEYGTSSTTYGASTPTREITGTTAQGVSYPITGLAPGTTYYFRIVASSATGESYGGPVAFTTQPPPTVTTTAASGVQEGQATLNATVNPNGLDAKYYFEYGETTAYGSSTSQGDAGSGGSAVPENATIADLQSGMAYHYRIIAITGAGTSYGGDQAFTMSSKPAEAIDSLGQRWISVEGPNNSLYGYFENTKSEVGGPREIGKAGSTYSAPATAIDSLGQRWYAVEGPNHTLDAYFENTKSEVGGPRELGKADSTYSAPALAVDKEGQRWYSAEGPDNSLYAYFENTKSEVGGPRELGKADSTYSAPAEAIDSLGQRWFAAEGPSNSLYDYFENTKSEVGGPRELGKAGTTW